MRRVLRIEGDSTEGAAAYEDEDEGIAGLEFHARSPPAATEDVQTSEQSEFGNATAWLRRRSPDQFEELRKAGLRVDLCVAGYTGTIPSDLVKELSRLGLGLVIIAPP
jgi:hypothetical protein